jgi:hypothetical protein
VVIGTIAWSLATKAKTGSGLPPGPGGLLGAVEGVSYLSLLGGERAVAWWACLHADCDCVAAHLACSCI